MLKRLRDLFNRPERPYLPGPDDGPEPADAAWSMQPVREIDPLTALLDEVEATALRVYAAHDMPTRAGEYVRLPGTQEWRFLAERLSHQEKWALLTAQPIEEGFHYGTLADLGARSDGPPVHQASGVLRATAHLRGRVAEREPGLLAEDIEAALRLGADWQALRETAVWQKSSLKLTRPRKGKSADKPAA